MASKVDTYEISLDTSAQMRKIQQQTASEMVNYLKQNTNRSTKNRENGHLADNWTVSEVSKGSDNGYYQFVWGGKSYMAVHLLENGVPKHNQPPNPVLKQAFEKYSKIYENRIRNMNLKATSKKV